MVSAKATVIASLPSIDSVKQQPGLLYRRLDGRGCVSDTSPSLHACRRQVFDRVYRRPVKLLYTAYCVKRAMVFKYLPIGRCRRWRYKDERPVRFDDESRRRWTEATRGAAAVTILFFLGSNPLAFSSIVGRALSLSGATRFARIDGARCQCTACVDGPLSPGASFVCHVLPPINRLSPQYTADADVRARARSSQLCIRSSLMCTDSQPPYSHGDYPHTGDTRRSIPK